MKMVLAAGSLLGGAFFHMLPEAVEQTGNEPTYATSGSPWPRRR